MDSQNQETSSTKRSSSGKVITSIVIIVVIVIVAAGGYFWYKSKKAAVAGTMANGNGAKHEYVMHPSGSMGASGGKGHMHMDMKPQPIPTLSAQQTQEVSAGTSTTTTQKTFDINGGNFYFTPNKITVNKGDKVTFVLHNDGGFHNLNIDELGVKSDTITTGKTSTVTFTADKTGSFVYYCSVSGHRQKGMWGTLVVQ